MPEIKDMKCSICNSTMIVCEVCHQVYCSKCNIHTGEFCNTGNYTCSPESVTSYTGVNSASQTH